MASQISGIEFERSKALASPISESKQVNAGKKHAAASNNRVGGTITPKNLTGRFGLYQGSPLTGLGDQELPKGHELDLSMD